MNELEKIQQKLVDCNKKSFEEAFKKYKDFNRFDEFVEESTKEGNRKICNPLTLKEIVEFDVNKTMWENVREAMIKQCEPNLEDTKFNMAIMFCHNLENEIVIDYIKRDSSLYDIMREELIKEERFEDIGNIKKYLQKNI